MLLTISLTATVFAQDGGRQRRTPEERAKHQVEMMQELTLSESQQQEIYKFNMELPAGNVQSEEDREAKMARGKATREKRAVAYQKILTQEQYAQYEKMQAVRRADKQKNGDN